MARTLLGVAVLGSGAAAAACGGSSVDASTITDAATKTALVGTYDISVASTFTPPGTNQSATVTATGGFDVPRHRGRVAVDFTTLAPVIGQNLGTMLVVLDGNTVYVKLPILRQASPQLKPWLKLTVEQTARARGFDLASLLQFGQGGNPSPTFDFLRGAEDVKKLGTLRMRGVPTTHYGATIDLSRAAKAAPPRARAKVNAAVARFSAVTGEKKLPAEVWLDRRGRARRILLTEHLRFGGKRAKVVQAADYYDFGTPVSVPIPAPGEVTDVTKLPGAGGGG
jgi:hypothetical protein